MHVNWGGEHKCKIFQSNAVLYKSTIRVHGTSQMTILRWVLTVTDLVWFAFLSMQVFLSEYKCCCCTASQITICGFQLYERDERVATLPSALMYCLDTGGLHLLLSFHCGSFIRQVLSKQLSIIILLVGADIMHQFVFCSSKSIKKKWRKQNGSNISSLVWMCRAGRAGDTFSPHSIIIRVQAWWMVKDSAQWLHFWLPTVPCEF